VVNERRDAAMKPSISVPGAVLLWNRAERSTTFVDSAHLTVATPHRT
jgi:hypothetical protein